MRLSKTAAFYLQASIILFFLAGSSAPTPLYAVYQAAWGFSPVMITVIFGIYALAVLATLLVVGSLSDYVGRRPVLIVATLLQLVAMAIFVTAHGVAALLLGRVIQGLSVGAAAGAVGAGLLDLDRDKGTLANAVGPMLGTATGGFVSGLMAQYLPAPTTLVYVVLSVVFAVQTIGVVLMPESVTRRRGALASLRPQFRLPAHVRGPMLLAAPALIAAWSLAGFYGSLGPMLVRRLVGGSSLALGGLALFALAGSGALTVFVSRSQTPRTVLTVGMVSLLAGVAVTLVAIAEVSTALFFVGTVIAGAGFGFGFQGAIRTVIPLVSVQDRAGVLSIVYVIAYVAMGVPAVLGGVRLVHGGGVFATAREYGIAVMMFAALALVGMLIRRPIKSYEVVTAKWT